jgi:KDO2-lipid IV(A) lauroyltransferase
MVVLNALPRTIVLALARSVGFVLFYIIPRERDKVLANLSFAYKNALDKRSMDRLAREVFINFAFTLGDLVLMWKMSTEDVKALVVISPENEEKLQRILREPSGIVFIVSHIGNWELLSAYMSIRFDHSRKTQAIGKRLNFAPYNKLIVRLRERFNTETIYRDTSFRTVVKTLKNGGAIGILPDQDVKNIPGIFVDFFDRPAYTTHAPARLASISNSVIVPLYMIRSGDKYEMLIDDCIYFDHSKNHDEEVRNITQKISLAIEKRVKQYPAQWGWTHNRWETQPGAVTKERHV